MKALLPLVLLLAVSVPLQAETYKWVDERGVTNYSNTPPPARALQRSVVEERISVVPADPSLRAAGVALHMREARRAQAVASDWRLRQQFAAAPAALCPYGDCFYSEPFFRSYPAYFVVRHARAPVLSRHPRHFSVSR